MRYYVYMLINENKNRLFSYVGYTNNIEKRIMLHNNSNGAKFTRGRKWMLCYKETYLSKSKAIIEVIILVIDAGKICRSASFSYNIFPDK